MRSAHFYPGHAVVDLFLQPLDGPYIERGKSCYEVALRKKLILGDVMLISGLSYKEGIDVVLFQEKGGDVLLNLTESITLLYSIRALFTSFNFVSCNQEKEKLKSFGILAERVLRFDVKST
ncbi:unnamed protein product [Enterobius vermicularis]|uniref:Peptidase_S24 domain-containing protein n=1 Tax=Enterobius vermicularis TaxID=51028 RepID=A0A0N4V595_ENTVE|nr:unnamed protein product [Enterobius vermicularis]